MKHRELSDSIQYVWLVGLAQLLVENREKCYYVVGFICEIIMELLMGWFYTKKAVEVTQQLEKKTVLFLQIT